MNQPDAIAHLRQHFKTWKPNTINPDLQRDLKHGWLFPMLDLMESALWSRWDYWALATFYNELPNCPIPQIEFECGGNKLGESFGHKHLQKCLDLIPKHGGWEGYSSEKYIEYFFDWLLYGFGYAGQPELPKEPSGCEGASIRLYQYFNLGVLLVYPYDYWADILAMQNIGKGSGFFPTPHTVCRMMAMMNNIQPTDSTFDPCVGTGRMLLESSNYSLALHGQDLNLIVLKAALVNSFCYVPWMVRPFAFLSGGLLLGDSLSQETPKIVSDWYVPTKPKAEPTPEPEEIEPTPLEAVLMPMSQVPTHISVDAIAPIELLLRTTIDPDRKQEIIQQLLKT